jgi:hypothetical protein
MRPSWCWRKSTPMWPPSLVLTSCVQCVPAGVTLHVSPFRTYLLYTFGWFVELYKSGLPALLPCICVLY